MVPPGARPAPGMAQLHHQRDPCCFEPAVQQRPAEDGAGVLRDQADPAFRSRRNRSRDERLSDGQPLHGCRRLPVHGPRLDEGLWHDLSRWPKLTAYTQRIGVRPSVAAPLKREAAVAFVA